MSLQIKKIQKKVRPFTGMKSSKIYCPKVKPLINSSPLIKIGAAHSPISQSRSIQSFSSGLKTKINLQLPKYNHQFHTLNNNIQYSPKATAPRKISLFANQHLTKTHVASSTQQYRLYSGSSLTSLYQFHNNNNNNNNNYSRAFSFSNYTSASTLKPFPRPLVTQRSFTVSERSPESESFTSHLGNNNPFSELTDDDRERMLQEAAQALRRSENHEEAGERLAKEGHAINYYRGFINYNNAIDHLWDALRIKEMMVGENHGEVIRLELNIAELYTLNRDWETANRLYEDALQKIENELKEIPQEESAEHRKLFGMAKMNYSGALTAQKEYGRAEKLALEGLEIMEKEMGLDNYYVKSAVFNIGLLYDRRGMSEEAEAFKLEWEQKLVKHQQKEDKMMEDAAALNPLTKEEIHQFLNESWPENRPWRPLDPEGFFLPPAAQKREREAFEQATGYSYFQDAPPIEKPGVVK